MLDVKTEESVGGGMTNRKRRMGRTERDAARHHGGSAAGRLLVGLLLASSSSSGTNGTGRFSDGSAAMQVHPVGLHVVGSGVAAVVAAAAAASTNVAAAPAAARRAAAGAAHHAEKQEQPQRQRRRRRPRNHHHQGQQDRERDCVFSSDHPPSPTAPRPHARGCSDTLLGVPPVRIRSASGGMAFLPPELASPPRRTGTTCTSVSANDASMPSAAKSRSESGTGTQDADICGTEETAGMPRQHPHHRHHQPNRRNWRNAAPGAKDIAVRRRTMTTSSYSSTKEQIRSFARGATRDDTNVDGNDNDNADIALGERNTIPFGSRGSRINSGLLRVPCSIAICMDEHGKHSLPSSTRPTTSTTANKSHHRRHDYRGQRNHHLHRRTDGPASSLRAFVDTGAEVTVLSAEAAQRAGLLHLLDRRYAGRATGVGSCRVLGRLPAGCATLVLGRECGRKAGGGDGEDNAIAMPCPQLIVLEETGTEGVDLLIGLDILEEYGASISLRGCTLTLDQSPTMRAASTEPPAPRIVIALARNNCGDDDNGGGHDNDTVGQSSLSTPSSAPLLNSGALEDGGHHGARGTNSADGSGRPSCRRRGRREDDDLIADLELLEQEASSSHYSSGSDWAEEDVVQERLAPRVGLVGRQGEEFGGEEEEDSESEEYEDDYGNDFDMSGV